MDSILAAVFTDIRLKFLQHLFGFGNHCGILGSDTAYQPLRQREFRGQRGTAHEVRIHRLLAVLVVRLQHDVGKRLFVDGDKPGKIIRWIADP